MVEKISGKNVAGTKKLKKVKKMKRLKSATVPVRKVPKKYFKKLMKFRKASKIK